MSGPKVVERSGTRHGTFTILERDTSRTKGTYWLARCDCGRMASLFAGDIVRGANVTCRSCAPRSAAPSYRAAHTRVEIARGKARAYRCACGAPAREWSYRHDDPDELHGSIVSRGKTWAVAYSSKPEHFDPRCVPCHRRFDVRAVAA